MMWPAESGLFLPSNIINYLSIDVDQGKKKKINEKKNKTKQNKNKEHASLFWSCDQF